MSRDHVQLTVNINFFILSFLRIPVKKLFDIRIYWYIEFAIRVDVNF